MLAVCTWQGLPAAGLQGSAHLQRFIQASRALQEEVTRALQRRDARHVLAILRDHKGEWLAWLAVEHGVCCGGVGVPPALPHPKPNIPASTICLLATSGTPFYPQSCLPPAVCPACADSQVSGAVLRNRAFQSLVASSLFSLEVCTAFVPLINLLLPAAAVGGAAHATAHHQAVGAAAGARAAYPTARHQAAALQLLEAVLARWGGYLRDVLR